MFGMTGDIIDLLAYSYTALVLSACEMQQTKLFNSRNGDSRGETWSYKLQHDSSMHCCFNTMAAHIAASALEIYNWTLL